jgi:hypothetical protein
MSSAQPIRVTRLRGRITEGTYGKGSKSERETVFIETTNGRYVLRRKSGPVFGDPEMNQYIGHQVECDGFLIGKTVLAEQIDIVY